MNGFTVTYALERRQSRVIRWTMLCSLLFHAGTVLLGTAVSSLFPGAPTWTVMEVDLTEEPPMALREEEPAPPTDTARRERAAETPAEKPARKATASERAASPDRWLRKLDARFAKVPDAHVLGKTVRPGIPSRRWETGAPPRPGDLRPAVAPEKTLSLGKALADLEDRVRRSGRPAIGTGGELQASTMFGGTGDPAGEPLPSWIRDMIRKRVRARLPELEAAYSSAIRRNPEIKGRLLVRFRIDPSGKIQRADPVESSFSDDAFVASVLEGIRRWTFDPTSGRTVEVLYPFVFVAPS